MPIGQPRLRFAPLHRTLLVAALSVAGAGLASAAIAPAPDLASVSTEGEPAAAGRTAPAAARTPSTSALPDASVALAPDSTTGTSATRTTRTRAATAAAPAAPAASTVAPTTSTTVFDWRAEGLPGPPGSVYERPQVSPYVVHATGARSALSVTATADGGRPGTVVQVSVEATWAQHRNSGSIVLVGPLDYTRSGEDQPTRVLDSWSLPCPTNMFAAGEARTVSFEVPLEYLVKPDFRMDHLRFELMTTQTSCAEGGGRDAYLALDFHIAEPYVIVQPSPPMGRTG